MDVGATARRAALSGVTIRRAKSVALLMAYQRAVGRRRGAERLFDSHYRTPGCYAGLTRGMSYIGLCVVTLRFRIIIFLTATFSFKVVTTGRSGTPSILARHSARRHGLPYGRGSSWAV